VKWSFVEFFQHGNNKNNNLCQLSFERNCSILIMKILADWHTDGIASIMLWYSLPIAAHTLGRWEIYFKNQDAKTLLIMLSLFGSECIVSLYCAYKSGKCVWNMKGRNLDRIPFFKRVHETSLLNPVIYASPIMRIFVFFFPSLWPLTN